MFGLFSSILSFFHRPDTVTDYYVFRLHYKVTTAILIACSVIVSTKSLFGEPINCMGSFSSREIPQSVINLFCWIHATFTVMESDDVVKDLVDMPYPGIGTNNLVDERMRDTSGGNGIQQQKIYHDYYQWVGLLFMIQAACFYFPRYLWRIFENGKTKRIFDEIKRPFLGVAGSGKGPKADSNSNDPEDNNKDSDRMPKTFGVHNKKMYFLAQYLFDRRGQRQGLCQKYFFCECLNFVNVIAQMFVTDAFLHGQFLSYGSDVIRFYRNNDLSATTQKINPMVKVFPLMTKCTFYRFGVGGSVTSTNVLCVLPINIINEKIFLALWFWYIVLACISGAWILGWIAAFTHKPFRLWLIVGKTTEAETGGKDHKDAKNYEQDFESDCKTTEAEAGDKEHKVAKNYEKDFESDCKTTEAEAGDKEHKVSKNYGEYFVNNSSMNDWLQLRIMKKNVDPMNFDVLAAKLDQLLEKEEKENRMKSNQHDKKTKSNHHDKLFHETDNLLPQLKIDEGKDQ